jgi:hypothetical protein
VSEVVGIARKLDAVAVLVSIVVSLAAICPCLPTAPTRHGHAAADQHACCSGGASPNLVAAHDSCCDDRALAERAAATPTSAGVSLGADTAVAVIGWNASAIERHQASSSSFASRPPSILRI